MGAVKKVLKGATKAVGYLTGTTQAAESAKKQVKAMEEANRIAQDQAKKAEMQINEANARTPDIDAIAAGNAGGIGTTMLTGAGGMEVDETNKKKRTLLGA